MTDTTACPSCPASSSTGNCPHGRHRKCNFGTCPKHATGSCRRCRRKHYCSDAHHTSDWYAGHQLECCADAQNEEDGGDGGGGEAALQLAVNACDLAAHLRTLLAAASNSTTTVPMQQLLAANDALQQAVTLLSTTTTTTTDAKTPKPSVTKRDDSVGAYIHDRYPNFWNWLTQYDRAEDKELIAELARTEEHWFVLVPIPDEGKIRERAPHVRGSGGERNVSMARYVIGTYVGKLAKRGSHLPTKKSDSALSIAMLDGRHAVLHYVDATTFRLELGPYRGEDAERDAYGGRGTTGHETVLLERAKAIQLSNGFVLEGRHLQSVTRHEFVEGRFSF